MYPERKEKRLTINKIVDATERLRPTAPTDEMIMSR